MKAELNREQLNSFFDLCKELEPDNLTSNGMATQYEIKHKIKSIHAKWVELEDKYKQRVLMNEVLSEYYNRQMLSITHPN